MVEDEFLATARAFTAHLHHAEYVRLKNAAREKAEKGIGLERPVDGVTAMRAETLKRKEGQVREKKMRGALDGILPSGKERRASDVGSDFEEEEGERHDDPWAGTQLQHFMTKSPMKQRAVGLTGLQGVVSHTRAAAGFQKWEKRDGNGRGGSPTLGRGDGDGEEEDDEDTDDLDAPTYTRPRSIPSLAQPKTKTKASEPAVVKHPPAPKPNAPRAFLDMTPLPIPKSKTPTSPQPQPAIKQEKEPLIKFERQNNDRDKGDDALRSIRERAEARRRRREGKREGGGVGKGKEDEIPVFLV